MSCVAVLLVETVITWKLHLKILLHIHAGVFVAFCMLTFESILHNCIILDVATTFFLKFLTVLCILSCVKYVCFIHYQSIICTCKNLNKNLQILELNALLIWLSKSSGIFTSDSKWLVEEKLSSSEKQQSPWAPGWLRWLSIHSWFLLRSSSQGCGIQPCIGLHSAGSLLLPPPLFLPLS